MLQIAERFFDSVTLFALFETGVFKILSFGPKILEKSTAEFAGNEETLRATLDAGVSLKLLTLQDGRYGASELVLDCLGRGDANAYLGEWVAFLHALVPPLAMLGELYGREARRGHCLRI